VEILTLTYRSDEDAMRGLLPEPLEPTGPWVMIHFHRMNDASWLGPYQEVNMKFGAKLPGAERGTYSPCLFLS
jgi:acetoacetate decarboxylase